MVMHAASCCLHNYPSSIISSPNHPLLSHRTVSSRISTTFVGSRHQRTLLQNESKSYSLHDLNRRIKDAPISRLTRRFAVCASTYNQEDKFSLSGQKNTNLGLAEPFCGKPGSVSFSGVTYQSIEENKLVSAPFDESSGSFLWVLAPIALVSSLVLPQFLVSSVFNSFSFKPVLSEMIASITSEIMFYIGLSIFLQVTDQVQKPYLQFSPKRWGLITGLKGYLTSAFFTMGLKVFAPIFAVFATWPILGFPALVSVAPFLVGCGAQFIFERRLEKRGSSSWPLVPIIFEVYRLYQLGKAASFIQKLMLSMKGVSITPKVVARSGALYGMVVTFQVLGFVCLWSLLTFLMRLFPSRPVAENY